MNGPDPAVDARAVRQRLGQVIVAATDEEKKAVMQEVKRLKPFRVDLDLDLDSSIVLHLCRSLKDFADSQTPDASPSLVLNVVRTVICTLPTCKILNEPVCGSPAVSLWDNVVQLAAAVLIRLPVDHFRDVELLLLKFLINTDIISAALAMDIWCIIFRAAEEVQVTQTELLMQLALSFPPYDVRRNNIHLLISRFMNFMDEEIQQYLVKKYNPITNGFHFALKYLTAEEKEAELKRLLDQVFGSNSCIFNFTHCICHLLTLVPVPDEMTVTKVTQLVDSFKDKISDPAAEHAIADCVRLLSKAKVLSL